MIDPKTAIRVAAICLAMAAPLQAGDRQTNAATAIATIAGVALLAKILKDQREARQSASPQPTIHHVKPAYRGHQPAAKRQTRARASRRATGAIATAERPYRVCLRQRWSASGWITYLQPACIAQVNEARARRHGLR